MRRTLVGAGICLLAIGGVCTYFACSGSSEAQPKNSTPAAAVTPTVSPAPAAAGDNAAPAPASTATAADVEGLGLELSGLDDGQKKSLKELLDKYPSACGKPHSLFTSLKTDPTCRRSKFAGNYLARMLKAGLLPSECEEMFEKRFVSPEMGNCDIAGAPVRGNPSAPVTICEFSDFQCPHCKMMEPILGRLLTDLGGRVKLYYKNYPLSKIHPEAMEAATAAVAAGKQGKFWQMHDQIFEHQDHLSEADLQKYAESIHLDVKKWKSDLDGARADVEKDRTEGQKLDISGTPTLYINGRKYSGPLRYEEVRDWVEEELAK